MDWNYYFMLEINARLCECDQYVDWHNNLYAAAASGLWSHKLQEAHGFQFFLPGYENLAQPDDL